MSIVARFRRRTGAFDLDVAFEVPSQGVTALIGPSGCGKTTLLRAVAGLERIPDGSLSVDGEVWQDADLFRPVHERALGYVFQEASLFPHLSVRGNLEYGMRRRACGDMDFDRTVELMGLAALLDRDPAGLSGGERQRTAVARALLAGPRLLLMDEPLASLDRESRDGILPFLDQLHRELEIPVLYVSHDRDETARLADHVVCLEAGRVLGAGPVADMMTRLDLPLARGADAEAVVEAVTGPCDHDGVTALRSGDAVFQVAGEAAAEGAPARLRIRAADVSLALDPPGRTSILNVLPGRVLEMVGETSGTVLVRVDVGGPVILSRITGRSRSALGLESGSEVFAQVKTVALLS